ncbi:MAG: sodium-dependent transporter [Armatimonadetes bacterium]|nr:sodium-dependent transporter [Armatimonadota bacterium]
MNQREHWASRIGLVLAMAGSAVGLGNFLRFPVQAAGNGGGAFMIPYFAALILLAVPLMWAEWAMGRFGGVRGHGTTPGIFKLLWPGRISKYLGVLGIAFPLTVLIWYTYVESWTLAYSYFSLTGAYAGIETRERMAQFLSNFLGGGGYATAYIFFIITILLNFVVIYRGITRGIEALAKIAMPILFLFAVILVIRVFTLRGVTPEHPDWNVVNGLAFLWNPRFEKLGDLRIWLAAAGQVFFTLSLGYGVIQTYASYVRKNDDIALSGLATTATNEFAEVVLGGSLAIPLAFAFFGPVAMSEIAKAGAFDLGFMSMPIVFGHLPLGWLLGALWFGLLFFAGITSSVSLAQPAVAFLEDELGWSRKRSSISLFVLVFIACQCVIFGKGFLDELDFLSGTAGIVLFAAIEVIIFAWIFGMERGWEEITSGADIRVPRIFYYVLKYVTPLYLIGVLAGFIIQQGFDVITLSGTPPEQIPWKWGARALVFGLIIAMIILVRFSKRLRGEVENGESGNG